MRTKIEMPENILKKWMELLAEYTFQSPVYPVHFARCMKKNTGMVAGNTIYAPEPDGMERRNPVIAVLGDSISAGHFEWAIEQNEVEKFLKGELKESEENHLEVVDLQAVYHEQFRMMLADHYGNTSVSVVNAGIAGDTLFGMKKRLYRDVLCYQPDLIILNGSMNWNDALGTTEDYRKLLETIIEDILRTSKGDLILLTPNFSSPIDPIDTVKLRERVECIRTAATQFHVCLGDVYGFWETFCEKYHPDISTMLANKINHPTPAGHTAYAKCLIQLVHQAAENFR